MQRAFLGLLVAAGFVFSSSLNPAQAGSQCFKNRDKQHLYITLRYANGDKLVMRLKPGEKRRFDNVRSGDAYCYSFNPIGEDCPNRNPVHLTSCQNPELL